MGKGRAHAGRQGEAQAGRAGPWTGGTAPEAGRQWDMDRGRHRRTGRRQRGAQAGTWTGGGRGRHSLSASLPVLPTLAPAQPCPPLDLLAPDTAPCLPGRGGATRAAACCRAAPTCWHNVTPSRLPSAARRPSAVVFAGACRPLFARRPVLAWRGAAPGCRRWQSEHAKAVLPPLPSVFTSPAGVPSPSPLGHPPAIQLS